ASAALREQRTLILPLEQGRHQILKHRAAPREKCQLAIDLGALATQLVPMPYVGVAFGDRNVTGQSCLGTQHVVMRAVKPFFVSIPTDGEQFAAVVHQEPEVGRRGTSL